MFTLQNAPARDLELPELKTTTFGVDSKTAKFDLTLDMTQQGDHLSGSLEYNTDLFEAVTISRMLEHFCNLLQSVVSNPEQALSSIPILHESERQQLLEEWNDTRKPPQELQCFHRLFEAQVERTPHAIALVFEDEQLTYKELNRRANQLANYLRDLEVGPEVLVAIYMDRSVDMVISQLAILKAGGAYVPLDTSYPQERLAYMLEDAQVPVLLTQQRLIGSLPETAARIVCPNEKATAPATVSDQNVANDVSPANLAYVIYTSGSTGKPKGVQITHRAVVNFLDAMLDQPGLDQQDILLAVTSISFDIAALELFLPLTVGARVVLVSHEVTVDGARLLESVVNTGATVMQATPSSWSLLLKAGWKGNGLSKLLCGGEALRSELANQLLEANGVLWNLYGPTETTIWSASHKVTTATEPKTKRHPKANTQIYLLDSNLQPVPIGVPGELH